MQRFSIAFMYFTSKKGAREPIKRLCSSCTTHLQSHHGRFHHKDSFSIDHVEQKQRKEELQEAQQAKQEQR